MSRRGSPRRATSTRTSTSRLEECSTASAPEVSASPAPNAMSPRNWCRAAPSRPRTPNVSRRFAAVFPTAVSSSASAFAACAPITPRNTRYSTTYATVLATPISRT